PDRRVPVLCTEASTSRSVSVAHERRTGVRAACSAAKPDRSTGRATRGPVDRGSASREPRARRSPTSPTWIHSPRLIPQARRVRGFWGISGDGGNRTRAMYPPCRLHPQLQGFAFPRQALKRRRYLGELVAENSAICEDNLAFAKRLGPRRSSRVA